MSLIPETLERTTLGTAEPGRPVNLEVDVLAKYVEKLRSMSRPFATVEEALEEIRAGRMVVVCDDEDRENEGDLTMAAQFATPEAINFMAKEGRGLICLALTPERCDELGPGPDGGQERVAVRDRLHRLRRGARRHHHRHQRRRPRAHDPGRRSTRGPRRATSSSPATSSR